jgi:hypothetical protein
MDHRPRLCFLWFAAVTWFVYFARLFFEWVAYRRCRCLTLFVDTAIIAAFGGWSCIGAMIVGARQKGLAVSVAPGGTGLARTAWSSGRAGLQQSSSSDSSMGVPNDALKRITDSRKCAQARPLGSSQFCRPRQRASSLAMSRIGADRPPSDRSGFRGTIPKAGYPLAAGQMRSDIFEKWHRTSCEEQHEKGPRPTVRRTVGGPPCAISVPGDRSFGSDDATRVTIQECFKASIEQVGRRICSIGEV